jgi:hypothetical protein
MGDRHDLASAFGSTVRTPKVTNEVRDFTMFMWAGISLLAIFLILEALLPFDALHSPEYVPTVFP